MNCATNLEASALFFPHRPALFEDGCEITYAQLNHQANRVATALIGLGVTPGDHVGLCAPNSTDWIAFYFGVLKAGAVAITLSGLLTGDELTVLVEHAKPRLMFATAEKLKDLQDLKGSLGLKKVICPGGDLDMQHLLKRGTGTFEAVERDRADTAAVLYTGGTTGIPKGVMLSHENINVSAYNVAHSERSTQADRALCFLPLNHVFGQIHIMNATVLSAGCLEILPGFDMGRILEATQQGRVTKLFAVPTVYARLLTLEGLKEKLGAVRYCFSAAASMAVEFVKQWKEVTGITISEGYGLTESASAVTYNHYYRHVVGPIGTPVPLVEVQIRDFEGGRIEAGREGEICIRGPNIMKGYLDNPEETRAAFLEGGWFRSGDVGRFDPDGYVYIVDRLKDVVITGGENVYPREVEEIIYGRPEVAECAVLGVPDREWGERVIAFIMPEKGHVVVAEELKAHLKTRLSPFKVPKEYIIVTEMPKSAVGKILKRELKKRYEALASGAQNPETEVRRIKACGE
jgi:long-chain acyl-CoA synthetase